MRAEDFFIDAGKNSDKTLCKSSFYDLAKQTRITDGLTTADPEVNGTVVQDLVKIHPTNNIRSFGLATGFVTKVSASLPFFYFVPRGTQQRNCDLNRNSPPGLLIGKVNYFDKFRFFGDVSETENTDAETLKSIVYRRKRNYQTRGVKIGEQVWDDMNLNQTYTAAGTDLIHMPDDTTAKITGAFDFTTYQKTSLCSGATPNTFTRTGSSASHGVYIDIDAEYDKYYKITIAGTTTSTGAVIVGNTTDPVLGVNLIGAVFPIVAGNFGGAYYLKWSFPLLPSLLGTEIAILTGNAGATTVTLLEVLECGWADATDIYAAVYYRTPGTAAQRELAALKESCFYRSPLNIESNRLIFGLLYNEYAGRLLNIEGICDKWEVPTEADFAILINFTSGSSSSLNSNEYWYFSPGIIIDNLTGFSALPAGAVLTTGVNLSLGKYARFFCTYVRIIIDYNNQDVYALSYDANYGMSIRAIQK